MKLFENDFSVISLEKGSGLIKLFWSEKTANMRDEDFKEASEVLAEEAERHHVRGLLVDVKNFKFPRATAPELTAWRVSTIVPKYNQAGVKKFAFVHGEGFVEPDFSGKPHEGENFITRHVGAETEARKWLLSP